MKKFILLGILIVSIFACNSEKTTAPMTQHQLINKDSIMAIYSKMLYVIDGSITSIKQYGFINCPTGYVWHIHQYVDYHNCGGNPPYWNNYDSSINIYPGDINYDKGVDIADLGQLVNYVNWEAVSYPFSIVGADFNVDGTVDISDLSALVDFLYYNGWSAYPHSCASNIAIYYGYSPSIQPFNDSGNIYDTFKCGGASL